MKTNELLLMIGEMISLIGQFSDREEKIMAEHTSNECASNLFNLVRDGAMTSPKEVIMHFQKDLRNQIVAEPSEFSGQIVDLYEDFCDNAGISITNPEKDAYDKEAGYAPGENQAKLFGSDYDSIADAAVQLIDESAPSDVMARQITNIFADILATRGSRTVTDEERKYLEIRVIALLDNWCLLEKEVA